MPTENEVRTALKIIADNREAPALNYAVNYAIAGMSMSGETLKTQCLYVLNNITYWRGDEAKRVRECLKAFTKENK